MQALHDLVQALAQYAHVLALVEFGSRHISDVVGTGDYDLLVVFERRDSPVSSLHFYIMPEGSGTSRDHAARGAG